VQNDARGISGGASKNRATRGSGATGGPVEESRQESRAARIPRGKRARMSEHGGSGWWAVFMNIDFE
jgi:hypothetical protein